MPGRAPTWGQLSDSDYRLIDVVVRSVLEFGEIPTLQAIADMLGISRQTVIFRMDRAAKRGIMRERPRYAIRWFELTPLGEDLYRKRRAEETYGGRHGSGAECD